MFNASRLSGPDRIRTRTRWTFLISLVVEVSILALLLLVPLIHVQELPFGWSATSIAPLLPPPPMRAQESSTSAPVAAVASVMRIPAFAPPHAVLIHDSTGMASPSGVESGAAPGAIPGLDGSGPWEKLFTSANPAAPSGSAGSSSPLSVGGNVEAALLLRMVRPLYPSIALQARVEGTVVLSAVIGADGTVQSLRAIAGPPMLIPAAEDAVRQWRYKPTLLNGKPIAVQTTIKVNFTLNRGSGGDPPAFPRHT